MNLTFKFLFFLFLSVLGIVHASGSIVVKFEMVPAVGSFDFVSSEVQQPLDCTFKNKDVVLSYKILKFESGNKLRDTHAYKMVRSEVYPELKIKYLSHDHSKLKLQMTFNGVTKDLEGQYKYQNKMISSQFKFNLSDFSVTDINYKGIGVNNEVNAQADLGCIL